MPDWSRDLGEVESEELLVNGEGLVDHVSCREVGLNGLLIDLVELLLLQVAVEHLVPWIKGDRVVF